MKRFNGHIGGSTTVGYDSGIAIELRNLLGVVRQTDFFVDRDILKRAGIRWRMSEYTVERLAAVNAGFAPDILLHALRGWNPRAARFAPARRAGDGFLHSELIGKGGGIFEGVLPLRRHVGQAMIDHLRSLQCGIEILETGQTAAMHPLEVELDAILADVAIHPMPPDTGAGTRGRVLKSALQLIFRGIRRGLDAGWRLCKSRSQNQQHP